MPDPLMVDAFESGRRCRRNVTCRFNFHILLHLLGGRLVFDKQLFSVREFDVELFASRGREKWCFGICQFILQLRGRLLLFFLS